MYQVEGYAFETKEQERIAKHELEVIDYIRSNTGMDDPDVVLALYNKLVLKEIFVTPVGYDFLHKLQEYLYATPYIKRDDILPIPVFAPQGASSSGEKKSRAEVQQRRKKQQEKAEVVNKNRREENRNYKRMFHVSTFFAVVFALCVVGMFVITWMSKDSLTIFNYENQIVDKYESWEKQLDEREQQLNERAAGGTEQEAE